MTTQQSRGRRLRIHRPVVYAVVGLAVALGAAKLWGPVSTARAQADVLGQLRRERADLQQEHGELRRDKIGLASDEGVEMRARRDGYLRPGDRRIVFVRGAHKPRPKSTPRR